MKTRSIGLIVFGVMMLAGCGAGRVPAVQQGAQAVQAADAASEGVPVPTLMIGNVAVQGMPASGCCDMVKEEAYVDLAPLLSPLSEVRVEFPEPPAELRVIRWRPDPLWDPAPGNPVQVRWLSQDVTLGDDGNVRFWNYGESLIYEVKATWEQGRSADFLFPIRVPRGYYHLRQFEPRLFGTGRLDGAIFVELRTTEGEQRVKAIAEALRSAVLGPRPDGLVPDLKLDLHAGMGPSLELARVKGRGVIITIDRFEYWTESEELLAALAPFEEMQLKPDVNSLERR